MSPPFQVSDCHSPLLVDCHSSFFHICVFPFFEGTFWARSEVLGLINLNVFVNLFFDDGHDVGGSFDVASEIFLFCYGSVYDGVSDENDVNGGGAYVNDVPHGNGFYSELEYEIRLLFVSVLMMMMFSFNIINNLKLIRLLIMLIFLSLSFLPSTFLSWINNVLLVEFTFLHFEKQILNLKFKSIIN